MKFAAILIATVAAIKMDDESTDKLAQLTPEDVMARFGKGLVNIGKSTEEEPALGHVSGSGLEEPEEEGTASGPEEEYTASGPEDEGTASGLEELGTGSFTEEEGESSGEEEGSGEEEEEEGSMSVETEVYVATEDAYGLAQRRNRRRRRGKKF